jgi:iron-sulfur cluster repair protein YtfE (RIC family)
MLVLLPVSARPEGAQAQTASLQIPESIRIEHEAIHTALVEATKAPGAVGSAAKELAAVLHPHFVREEEIALPPLGLLAPLAAGGQPAGMADAVVMADTLKKEMPRMLDEHTRIRAAVAKLRAVARAEHAAEAERLADELTLHAQTEEQVLYPAAILVGDLVRARSK